MSPRVAVIGGGISGLAAALELAMHPAGFDVVLFEAGEYLGGKLKSSPLAGLMVDEGADAFLARRPEAVVLARRLGLTERLVSPSIGWASVFWDGRRHRLPEGLVLGAPAGWAGIAGLARSPLIGPLGAARAAAEPLVAVAERLCARFPPIRWKMDTQTDRDAALGPLIRRRFGRRVAERLVDPLLGGINAGDADHLSLAASNPQLAAALDRSPSLLVGLARQRQAAPAGPVFLTPLGGTAELAAAIVSRLHGRVDIRTATAVTRLEPDRGRWSVDGERFDAAVAALPGWAAAPLLTGVCPPAAVTLAEVPYSSVAIVTLVVDQRAFPDGAAPVGTGVLVPKPQQRHVTAVSFGSQKWAHWHVPGREVLRVSVGRDGDEHALGYDDDTLLRGVLADLVDIIGLRGEPEEARITRWPRSFPQYRPGHLRRIDAAEAALAASAPGVALAGAALRGLGIPACIGSGQRAAAAVARHATAVAA